MGTRSVGGLTVDEARDLFNGWRAGDSADFDTLVRLLTPMLWHLARAYRVTEVTAEDAVQSTWAALVAHADSIADPQALVRWLSVTVQREAARLAKQEARAQPAEAPEIDLRLPFQAGPEVVALEAAERDVLWAHVSRLSPRCQQLLRVLAFADRPDYKRLSAELNVPVGSIGPTRGRCLNKLKEACLSDPTWSRS